MSIYFGNQKISVSHTTGVILNEGDEVIHATQMAALNDAVNYHIGEFNTKNISQIIEKLKENYLVKCNLALRFGEDQPTWSRPQEWPDLDSLNLQMEGDTDFIYMTYDGNQTSSASAIALYITGSNIAVTVGHINNGSYIVDETIAGSSNNYIKSLTNYGGYPVVRITGSITRCNLIANTVNGRTQSIKQQPMLERIAYIPHATSLASGSGTNWTSYYLQREKVNNGNGNALTYLGYAYDSSYALRSLDISGLKTQNVTSMTYMFAYCRNLYQILDLRHFDVGKVKTFESMFRDCFLVQGINLTGWAPPSNLNTGALYCSFVNCYSAKYIYGLINFNISSCTTLYCTFQNCYNLQELEDLSNWNTSNVTTFYNLFSGCMSLKNLDFISSWNTSKVTSLNSTFNSCINIEKLDLHNWDVSKVTNITSLFNTCISLKQLNITGWQISGITSLSSIFYRCICLKEIDLSNWHITNACNSIYACFYSCCSLQYLNIPNDWDLSGISANTGSSVASDIFSRCHSLKRITGISNWNLNKATAASSIFNECFSLEEVDVSGWNVSKLTSFSSLFANCWSLKNIDVSNWDTSSCTNFSSMFNNCRSLKTVNVSNFNVSNATNLSSMFNSCYSLISVGNLSNWDVNKVTNLYYLFAYCRSLIVDPNISNWNVQKVTDASYVFRECYSLKEITINNWNLAACTTIQGFFYYCYNLKKITATGWSLPKLTTAPTYIFQYCYSLTNYNGTIPITLNHNYNYQNSLTYESLINIFNNLPTVTTTRTINITSGILAQTTTTERQIATNKGWTIAG